MQFEKWQALGNDYVILEAANLPFELTPARVRRICAAHVGVGSDGVLLLSRTEQAGFVAGLRIFNPDGSEAGLSGNGAREAILYLSRHRWSDERQFSIMTPAGEIRASLTSDTSCSVDMATARPQGPDYPAGAPHGRGVLQAGGREWHFQHVDVGNPQCSIEVGSESELASLELTKIGPEIENHELFPNRTNVSWYTVLQPSAIRARIFERGVGETSASGTGAIGAAVAHVIRGGDSPVTVLLDGGELTVAVGEDLTIKLTGWAVPVISGTLSNEFMEALRATE